MIVFFIEDDIKISNVISENDFYLQKITQTMFTTYTYG